MSNNKSMKLYTEEQVMDAIKYGQNYEKMDKGEIPYVTDDEFINSLTHIKVPSDEEIWNQADEELSNLTKDSAFMRGAKWMRDKIQGGNNEQQ